MTRPLPNDIRERLVSAVDSGLSRRSAARRFGVAASTAIKWVDQSRRTGDVGPRPQGGDQRSHRIEAHAEEILALVNEKPEITLLDITSHLRRQHGLEVAQSTVWRLLDRHGMTFKKNRARRFGAFGL
jgi:transposase